MLHRIATLLIFSLLFVATSFVNKYAVAQPTHVVTNTADAGAGSLRQMIMDASPGDAITFDPQLTFQTITLNSGSLVIDKNLTIRGPGADSLAISGGQLFSVVEVLSGVDLQIEAITITEGNAALNGGGFHIERLANVTINRVVISNSKAFDNGGGLYTAGGSTTRVIETIITGNEALGATSPNGGGLYNAGGLLIIEQSVVTDNRSIRGGAVWNSGSGVMEIYSTQIEDNHAALEAGGVFNNNRLTMINSTLSHNQSDVEGGGLMNRGADTLFVINSTVSNNTAGLGGAFVNTTFGTARIYNSTLYQNQSTTPGGGIVNEETGNILLYSSIVANNSDEAGSASDLLNFGSLNSDGFNFIGNGDENSAVEGSKRFARQLSDFVGFNTFPLDPSLDVLQSNGGTVKAHPPRAGSPVIDNGDCDKTLIDLDPFGAPRIVDVPGEGFTNAGNGCDIGAVEASLSVALNNDEQPLKSSKALSAAYPNPFIQHARIDVFLENEEVVLLELIDVTGRRIRTLHQGILLSQRPHGFNIDAQGLPAGLYFVRITGTSTFESLPLVRIKG